MLKIRDYRSCDVEALVPRFKELGYPSDKKTLERRLANLLKNNYLLKVASLDETVVGFIGFSKLYFFERDGFYYRILALVVSESYRNRGIASCLMDSVKEQASLEGASALALNSGMTVERQKAHVFYQNYGFKRASYGFVLELNK